MRTEVLPQSDDFPYREYLLGIEDAFVTKQLHPDSEFSPPHTPEEIRQLTLQSLAKKFKQDFATPDNALIGAHRVAIEVMKAVLVEDLGKLANEIPAQGATTTDREYLDTLVGLSGRTPQELSSAYHIDLSRSDLQQTTRVHENIVTL